ncbi:MAG: hypothetical protein ABIH66_08870, partial [bacterium]
RLEMTARDGTKECCEHSRSFNFAFSSKGRKSPAPGEETAVAMVIHAISANDRGRLILRKDGEGNTELARVGREPGLWDRLASSLGNRGRPRRGENQPV